MIFALVSGVFISFLFYVSADGELRIYLLIGALAFYVICKKVFGARIFSLLQAVLKFTVKLVSVLFVFALLPLRFALRKVLYFANKIEFDLKARFRALRNRVNKGKNCEIATHLPSLFQKENFVCLVFKIKMALTTY